ncbi:MAG: murein hydrolase activator EnvC family protein [Persicimonas sp.]
MTSRRAAMALVVGSLALVSAPTDARQSADTRSVVERIEQIELEIERAERESDALRGELDSAARKLRDDAASPDTASRARQKVKARLAEQFVVWEAAGRRVERAARYLPPGEAADTRILLASAEPRAHHAHMDDIGVFQAITADLRRTRELVAERAGLTVELAQSDAGADASRAEKDAVVEEANEPENQKKRDRELERADESLANSVGMLLKNDTDRDFHQLKGTLLPPVTSDPAHRYGPRKQKGSMSYVRHTGLTWKVDAQTPVRSVAAGMVVYSGRFKGFGKLVIVDHGQDYHTLYAHLDSIDVEIGQSLPRGATLGASGESGSFEGPKLYFELRKNGQPLDPSPWLIQR